MAKTVKQLEKAKAKLEQDILDAEEAARETEWKIEDKKFETWLLTIDTKFRKAMEIFRGELDWDLDTCKTFLKDNKTAKRFLENSYSEHWGQQQFLSEQEVLELAKKKLNSGYDESWDTTIYDTRDGATYQLADMVDLTLKI